MKFLHTKQYRIVLGCGLVYRDHENIFTNWPKIHCSQTFPPPKNTRYMVYSHCPTYMYMYTEYVLSSTYPFSPSLPPSLPPSLLPHPPTLPPPSLPPSLSSSLPPSLPPSFHPSFPFPPRTHASKIQFWSEWPKMHSRLSPHMINLFNRIFMLLPSLRCTLRDIVRHPWVSAKTQLSPEEVMLHMKAR